MKEQFDPINGQKLAAQELFDSKPLDEQQEHAAQDEDEAHLLNSATLSDMIAQEKDPELQDDLKLALTIAETAKAAGGMALLVGGFARDEALRRFGYDLKPKDIDIEVYGIAPEQLKDILGQFGSVNVVGESFGVMKIGGLDVSIPRRDSKTGTGHKGFTIEGDPTMSIAEASKRRDFTINALALDPLTGEIVDSYGGLADMRNKTLRATDATTFAEDPLRVLRAMQFAGRFGFHVDPETVALCRSLDLKELPAERIGEEWMKLLTKSEHPSIGLTTARELGIIEQLHPELAALIDVPQEPEWHPEGDVWVHSLMAVDAAAEIIRREGIDPNSEQGRVILFATLCHDLGKPVTTETKGGRIISHEHSEQGVAPTKSFLQSLKISENIIAKVVPLVKEHLFPSLVKDPSDAAVRRLAHRLSPATIRELICVGEADHRGRALEWHGYPEGPALLSKAEQLAIRDEKPKPLIQGRDLIELGLKPGVAFKTILGQLFEAQLDGKFFTLEEGLEYGKREKIM